MALSRLRRHLDWPRTSVCPVSGERRELMMPPPDPGFMLWGSAYVILKWTVGLWAVRRVGSADIGPGLGDGGHVTLFTSRERFDAIEPPPTP